MTAYRREWPDLVVIVPTRGRVGQFNRLANHVRITTAMRAEVLGLVDEDDPDLSAYKALGHRVWTGYRRTLSGWTNHAAEILRNEHARPRYLASFGDDHYPVTGNWDRRLTAAIEALDGPGWAYGNDLYQGAHLPTAWVQSTDLVDVLGWMMLPSCEHMFVDAAVLALGVAANRITYCPDVIIEHRHPVAGKADIDTSYRATNTEARYRDDGAAFERWQADGLKAAAEAVAAWRYPLREAVAG